jgi:hypothetical protein
MHKAICLIIIMLCSGALYSQNPKAENNSNTTKKDSLSKRQFVRQLGNGFFPTKYINVDLKYLVKYNQYEGLRTGLGGVTNDRFSEKYRINSYVVYGFRDHRFKYKIGGSFRINESTDTWINLSYTDDLQETGSSTFLTDKRFFSFFEPRLLNIDLFHKHITKAISVEHKFSENLLSELEFATSKIDPTYDYTFNLDDTPFRTFDITSAKLALQWNPFNSSIINKKGVSEEKEGYPKFTLQLSQSFKNNITGDFNFFKTDFRTIHRFIHNKTSYTEATVTTGLAAGNTPLTHLYHAYPNNITKETILQRFSVAGINSFETMFFNEFFSDRFATLQLKHYIKPFKITERYRPQLVLISRMAIGNMQNIERHQNVEFGTLSKGYSEVGFEINRLISAFGLSFAYRYGGYHLPSLADNIAAKFTFNVSF